MNNNGKKLYDDDYMNWMMLNPDLYGMEGRRGRRTRYSGSSFWGGDTFLFMFVFILIFPFIFIKKIICGEELECGDIAFTLAGLFLIIIIIGIIYRIKSETNYRNNNTSNTNIDSDTAIDEDEDFIQSSYQRTEKYVAKNNNSFME